MDIKSLIAKYVPQDCMDNYHLWQYAQNKKRTYDGIEQIVDRKYYEVFRRHINWIAPSAYTEKINVDKVYNTNPLKTKLTDKMMVRDWIKDKIGEQYLIPLYGAYERFDDIAFHELPDQFVIKCNHDSGSVTVVNDKEKMIRKDVNILRKRYGFYMKRNFAYKEYEMHYKDIVPKILVEKYMGDNINDYKFLCFDGVPYYCWVDFDRFIDHRRNLYDLDWVKQPFTQAHPNYDGSCEKPACFSEMLVAVKTLCQGFPHVRIDMYEVGGHLYFGEMTFTNGSGMEIITPKEWNYKLGDLWHFDNTMRTKARQERT